MQKEKNSKFLKIMKVLLIISLIILICQIGMTIYLFSSHKMEYKSAPPNPIAYEYKQVKYTKEEVRSKVEKIAGWLPYFYGEKDLLSKQRYGETIFFLRLVIMHDDLDINNYIFNFAHEYMHLKYMTASERFVNFEAFKLLYESGDEYFRNVAIMYANQDMRGGIDKNYSCWYYIKEYLNK